MPKLIATEKTDRKALFAYVAWHEKVGNNNEHDRYFVKEYIRANTRDIQENIGRLKQF